MTTILRCDKHSNRRIYAECHNKYKPLGESVYPDFTQNRVKIRLCKRCSWLLTTSRCCLHQRQFLDSVKLEKMRTRHTQIANDGQQKNSVANHEVHKSRRLGRCSKCKRQDLCERRKYTTQRLTTYQSCNILRWKLATYTEQSTA